MNKTQAKGKTQLPTRTALPRLLIGGLAAILLLALSALTGVLSGPLAITAQQATPTPVVSSTALTATMTSTLPMSGTSAMTATMMMTDPLGIMTATNPTATVDISTALKGISPTVTAGKPTAVMQAVLNELAAFKAPPIETLSPQNAREAPLPGDAVVALLAKQGKTVAPEAVGDIAHKLINGMGDNQILLRIYTPKGSGPFPVIVYFHGGGWVIASLNAYDASARALTNAAKAVVVSVAYRQAPEHKFPAAVEDAYAAYRWVTENAASIHGDAKHVAVVGESAGGNLATVVSLLAKQRGDPLPVYQVLVYPVTQLMDTNTPSDQTYAAAKPLNKPMLDWFYGYYLPSKADAQNPYASPLLAADLKGLPPTTIIAAEIDPLFSDGQAYALRLQAAGVPVIHRTFKGVTHEFFGMGAVLPEARQAVQLAATNLRTAFAK